MKKKNRKKNSFWNPIYKVDKLEEVVPYEVMVKGLIFRKIHEYDNFVLYEHDYGKGKYYECFHRYDLKVYNKYGKEWE